MNICAKLQIISRKNYLKNFTILFKEEDNVQNEIISCEEFGSLAKNITVFEQNEIFLIIEEY